MAAGQVKNFDHPDETRPFVVGNEECVVVDFGEIGGYANPS